MIYMLCIHKIPSKDNVFQLKWNRSPTAIQEADGLCPACNAYIQVVAGHPSHYLIGCQSKWYSVFNWSPSREI